MKRDWPSDQPKLKPCPFCGGSAGLRGTEKAGLYVRCRVCGCRTGLRHNLGDLAAVWNNRVEERYD